MTIGQLQSRIAKAEGKKVQVPMGNVREIFRCLRDEFRRDPRHVTLVLFKYLCSK